MRSLRKIRRFLVQILLALSIGLIISLYISGETEFLKEMGTEFWIIFVLGVVLTYLPPIMRLISSLRKRKLSKIEDDGWNSQVNIRDFDAYDNFDDDTFGEPPKRHKNKRPSSLMEDRQRQVQPTMKQSTKTRMQTMKAGRLSSSSAKPEPSLSNGVSQKQAILMTLVLLVLMGPWMIIYYRFFAGVSATQPTIFSKASVKVIMAVGVGVIALINYVIKWIKTRGLTKENERLVSRVIVASRNLVEKPFKKQFEEELKRFFCRLQRKKNSISRIVGEDVVRFSRAFYNQFTRTDGVLWHIVLMLFGASLSLIILQFYLMLTTGRISLYGLSCDMGMVMLFYFWGVIPIPLYISGMRKARQTNKPMTQMWVMIVIVLLIMYVVLFIQILRFHTDLFPNISFILNRRIILFTSRRMFLEMIGIVIICGFLMSSIRKIVTKKYWRSFLRQRAAQD